MITLNKIKPFQKVSLLSLDFPSVAIFVPLFPQNNSTVYELLPKLNLLKTQFSKVYIPSHNKSFQGVRINTVKIYEELRAHLNNPWIKLFPPTRNLPKGEIFKNLIVDLFPVYNQAAPLFEKYSENYQRYWDLWYLIFIEELEKIVNEIKKNIPDKKINFVPIIISNPHSEDDLKKLEEFYSWLKLKELKLDTIIDSNLYYGVPFLEKPVYGLLAINKDKKFIFDRRALAYLYNLSQEYYKQIQQLATKVLSDTEKENIKNSLLEIFNKEIISPVKNKNSELENPEIEKIKNFVSEIISEYISEKQIEIKNPEIRKKIILDAIKEKLNLINTDLEKLTPDEIFEILRRHIVVTETITPQPVDERYSKIYNPQENLKLQSTVVNLHKKEFGERVDKYIRTLLQSLEELPEDIPIKKSVKNITRKLVDDQLNRYWLYTVTVQNDKIGETYDLQLKIPALINDRYFKLNGKTYILANQRFLKPITVTDKNKERLLTYYAIVTLYLRNFILSLNDVNEIIEYIKDKYPKLIKKIEEVEHPEEICSYLKPIRYNVEFNDGDVLYAYEPIGAARFKLIDNENKNFQIIYDAKKDRLIYKNTQSNEETILGEKLNEFLINFLIEKIHKLNPNDKLSSTTKLPYVEIYLGGFKMPYILFLFGNFGIQKSLEKLGIDYSITENYPDKKAYISIPLKNKKFLNIYPDTIKEKYIVNGLNVVSKLKLDKYDFNEFENNQNIRDKWLDELFGQGAARINLLFRRHMLDPVTKEILKAEGKSTDYFNVVTKELLTALFNSKVYKPTDLRIHRSRLSEVVLHILYKQIAQAKHELEKRALGLKEQGRIDEKYWDKYYLNPDYVIQQLLTGESLLQYTEPVNPIDELNTATRITPKGIGGIPSDALTIKHRLIPFEKDPKTGKYVTAHFQNISALDTNEYSNVGTNNQLTWTALISDKYGFFLNKPDITNDTFESLGIGESLAPYIQSIDHDRTIKMAQQLRQTIPIENPDIPHVASGAEFIIPQIVSQRFAIKAEKPGKIIDVEDGKYVIVQYEDGTQKMYNIMPRLARIKRGIFMPVKLALTVKKNQIVKPGQIIAAAQQLTKGIYAYGRNVSVALFTYRGKVYEDGWTVSESVLKKFKHKRYKEVIVIVPPDALVEKFVFQENTPLKFGDVLLKFKYDKSLEEYVEQNNLIENPDVKSVEDVEFIANNQGIFKDKSGIVVKSPVDGILKEVRIYINGRAPSVIEGVWRRMTEKYKNLIEKSKMINGEDDYSFEDTIDTSMFVKNNHTFKGQEFKGALIMFLIETERIPTYGDKFVFRGGNKGVITGIIPEGKEPVSEITKIKIDWIHNPLSNIGRKNANFFKEIQIGKIIYFLNKKVKEMADNPNIKTDEIKKLVIDVYSNLVKTAPPNDKGKQLVEKIIDSINNIPNEEFRNLCKSIKDPKEDPVFIWIALPFSKINEEDIKDTLENILNVPFLEKLYIPELNAYTERPIAVGFGYVTILEHMPDIMMGFRSTGKYTVIGQGAKGQSKEGEKASQSLDTLTLTGLLNRLGEDSEVVKELFTVQADDHFAKNYVISYIIRKGKAPEKYPIGETGSKQLMRTIMYGLGLDPGF